MPENRLRVGFLVCCVRGQPKARVCKNQLKALAACVAFCGLKSARRPERELQLAETQEVALT